MTRVFATAAALCLLLVAALPMAAHAQSYRAKPIRLIVAFPPGGSVDLTARIISEKLSLSLGQPIVVENRAGASGAIAEEFVSRATPDGYTILYTANSNMITRQFLSKSATVDPLRDLTPVATAVLSVNVVAVGTSHPATSLKELFEHARRNPGKLTYSSGGNSSYHHLIGELLKQHGIDLLQVPYKGLGPALTALVAGEVDIALTNFATALPHVKSGKVKVLAVLESSRYPETPDVPTVSEALPGFKAPPSWFGFFGPAGLPQPIVVSLNGEIAKVLESSEVSARIRGVYLNVLITPPEKLRPLILETTETFGRIVKSAGIQPTD
ncbi:MAG TPA: tripartite tricarboxylate transporter substrate binding protein [Burkholderiales bacterium]|jgi:tripartite-type tricarboxylate transporter receptor subunit TctC|nr:tripartite tricarboxylate transporter substrate binding protein [Burkholderiales bacterium]